MRQLFTVLLIMTTTCVYSQVSVGMHAGGSNKNLVVGVLSQYEFQNHFTVGLNLTAHADKINPAFIQTRFGYTLGEPDEKLTVQPYMGYSYGIQNFEQKNYGGHFTGGVQLRYEISAIAQVYVDINFPAPRYTMFTVGLAGRIPRVCN
jgi:hypothetical protein